MDQHSTLICIYYAYILFYVRIDRFIWDENNAIKNVVQHDTYPDEIEEVFYNSNKLRKTSQDRYLMYGTTDSGRYLFVVFVINRLAGKNVARVISAREMTKKEKNYYMK